MFEETTLMEQTLIDWYFQHK